LAEVIGGEETLVDIGVGDKHLRVRIGGEDRLSGLKLVSVDPGNGGVQEDFELWAQIAHVKSESLVDVLSDGTSYRDKGSLPVN
jgi:hypothetical protein